MTAAAAPIAPAGRRAARAQAIVVTLSFAMLFVASNALNPLLPVYRDALGLDPFTLSLTFASYVAVLAVTLFALARPAFGRHAAALLLASLAVLIAADVLQALPLEASILAGRALTGVAGGLGTGSASALVVAAVGASGRAVTVTGNFVGGVIGAGVAQLCLSLFAAAAPQIVFIGHAAITGVLLVAAAAVLWRRRHANRLALIGIPGAVGKARIGRAGWRMVMVGTTAGITVSIGVAFGATVFAELGQPVVQAVAPTLLLGASAIAQLASPAVARFAPWVSGMLAAALGAACTILGALAAAEWLAVAGFALLGLGIGTCFRASLVVLTHGAPPADQGALASLFAAANYTGSAVVVALIGWLGNATGLVPAALGSLGVVGVISLAMLVWAPRLRDTLTSTDAVGHRPLSEPAAGTSATP